MLTYCVVKKNTADPGIPTDLVVPVASGLVPMGNGLLSDTVILTEPLSECLCLCVWVHAFESVWFCEKHDSMMVTSREQTLSTGAGEVQVALRTSLPLEQGSNPARG